MPFRPIPLTVYNIPAGGPPPPPTQGAIFSAIWQATVVDPPQPVERFDLSSFYIPIAINAIQAGAGPPPAVCHFAPSVFLSGQVIFQQRLDIPLVPIAGFTSWVGGNDSAAASLSNPIAMRAGQTLQIGFQLQFDQSVNGLNAILAGVMNSPGSGNPTPSPGSIGYTIAQDELLFMP